jgi:hypothetical protein
MSETQPNTTENRPSYDELSANAETQKHINLVRSLLRIFATELLKRGEIHDVSKFSPEEAPAFASHTQKLKATTYGSGEYTACLIEMREALAHHYAQNKHHPEHWENGIDGMDLVDLVEMFLDWLAATARHADGDIMQSIEKNQVRFNMSPQLVSIFRNTAEGFQKRYVQPA